MPTIKHVVLCRRSVWGQFIAVVMLLACYSHATAQNAAAFTRSGSKHALSGKVNPASTATDRTGNIFISDDVEHRVRKVSPYGVMTTVAGTGEPGYNGEGDATTAQLNSPLGLTLDSADNLYIADANNNRIRKLTPAGVISTVVGNGMPAFAGDGGAAVGASLNHPTSVAWSTTGVLYIADSHNQRLRRVSSSGQIATIAGNGREGFSGDGGSATRAQLNYPCGLAFRNGVLYVTDFGNHRIRRLTSDGVMTTFVGNGVRAFAGDGGDARRASLNYPQSVAFDVSGNLLIADTGNNRVRKVSPARTISTIVGSDGRGFAGDGGLATSATLSYPMSVAVASSGMLYIADYFNGRVREVNSAGVIATVAGRGTGIFGVGDSDATPKVEKAVKAARYD